MSTRDPSTSAAQARDAFRRHSLRHLLDDRASAPPSKGPAAGGPARTPPTGHAPPAHPQHVSVRPLQLHEQVGAPFAQGLEWFLAQPVEALPKLLECILERVDQFTLTQVPPRAPLLRAFRRGWGWGL